MASAPPPLPDLDPLDKLSPYLTRILGQNPGKFTLQGTNSYLVHHPRSPSLLLVDTTGPSSSSPLAPSALTTYTAHLASALAQHPTQPARVTDVVLTHWHGDHVRALAHTLEALARAREGGAPPRVWKVPCAAAGDDAKGVWASERGKDAEIEQELERAVREGWVEPAQGVAREGEDEGDGTGVRDGATRAVRPLVDGQRFALGGAERSGSTGADDGDDGPVQLEVVHTPGHTSDSVCLVLRRSDPSSSTAASRASAPPPLALLTADTILGHGSSVFGSLSAYMSSLAAISALLPSPSPSSSSSPGADEPSSAHKVPLYPGHGAPCDDAASKVAEYRHHREEREKQVVDALRERAKEDDEAISAGDLTSLIYPPSLPPALRPAATHSLLQHLGKLHEEGRVERVPVAGRDEVGEGEGEGGPARKAPVGWFDGWRSAGERGEEARVGRADEGSGAGQGGEEAAGRL
ncbi:uncharacterized protein RHOBADRAFT_43112 [Rhodotorula graminis WP1]|uniref:Metallo-beta-lactamase domain-containing protein n=1 Tax=Rhodotorula graminis (strain WP1) TaxID=578459 RepID=A0A194S4M5_RHOGW|nr:uncharacterized protein RHOBADRAFT_43112 [Rhodotorula graminis WP1]KPV75688.1 hypothetical protein RHOBADRAFT_43112 [Rhodotorula graminis WP1]